MRHSDTGALSSAEEEFATASTSEVATAGSAAIPDHPTGI